MEVSPESSCWEPPQGPLESFSLDPNLVQLVVFQFPNRLFLFGLKLVSTRLALIGPSRITLIRLGPKLGDGRQAQLEKKRMFVCVYVCACEAVSHYAHNGKRIIYIYISYACETIFMFQRC